MSEIAAQVWKSSRFTVERDTPEAQSAVFRFSGPFTARDMYSSMSPDSFRDILESLPENGQPIVHIFDLTDVPYMDSRGLGMLVSHHVHCQNNGIQLTITGLSPRVRELFRLTKTDGVLQIAEIDTLDRS